MIDSSEHKLAVRYLEYGGHTYEGESVTLEAVERLVQLIQTDRTVSGFLSLDEYGEDGDDFLTVDIENGWAALAFNTWDEDGNSHMYQPFTQGYDISEEAPVNIGGQTPVLKRNALCDMKSAAECVLYFAKTGKPAPGLQWKEPPAWRRNGDTYEICSCLQQQDG